LYVLRGKAICKDIDVYTNLSNQPALRELLKTDFIRVMKPNAYKSALSSGNPFESRGFILEIDDFAIREDGDEREYVNVLEGYWSAYIPIIQVIYLHQTCPKGITKTFDIQLLKNTISFFMNEKNEKITSISVSFDCNSYYDLLSFKLNFNDFIVNIRSLFYHYEQITSMEKFLAIHELQKKYPHYFKLDEYKFRQLIHVEEDQLVLFLNEIFDKVFFIRFEKYLCRSEIAN
jgi:hypothetical protein